MSAMILSMGVFYGGLIQILAGLLEYKRGNTFATTAFMSYGAFWLTLVGLILAPKFGWAVATPAGFIGWYLFLWGFFTLCMFFGTLRGNRGLQVVFLSLTVLFFLLAARDWTGSVLIGQIAGLEGIGCGLSAIYVAMAEVLNEKYERTVLPIG